MSLFVELKRRNVFKVAVAYLVVGWLLMQVAEILVPALRLPEWVLTATVYFLIIGFLPALIFAWAFEMTPEGLRKEKDVDRDASITHVTGRKLDFTIIGLLAIAVIYLVLDKLGPDEPVPEPAAVAEITEPEPVMEQGPPPKSIAVLPFTNMSGDAENEYFSDGISEEILNALAKVKELKVAGRTSSFAFKGRNQDLRLMGETLDVSHILEGSVRKAGNTVRITAQLIKVEDGYHMWSETYDRELTDIFAIQDEIAAAILDELKAELMGDEQIASTKTDPRVYEKYLRATQLMYTRQREALEEAAALLDAAIEQDEAFAPAWAQRGIIFMLLSEDQYGDLPYADAQEQARRYLEHALELDDGLAEAWAGLGLNLNNSLDPADHPPAREHLEHALDINPNLINASNWLYGIFIEEYRAIEGMAVLEDVFARDPLYPPLMGNMSLNYLRLGQKEKIGRVLEQVRPFLQGRPNYEIALAAHMHSMGELSDALPVAEGAFANSPDSEFVAGALQRSLFFLNEFERAVEIPRSNPYMTIHALRYLGRNEEAVMLGRQRFEQSNRLSFPYLDAMAGAEKFEALVEFVEQTWGGVEQFSRSTAPVLGFGNRGLAFIAQAYQQTGKYEKFNKTMQLLRQDHDRQAAAGMDWPMFYITEAMYWTLAGDQEQAINYLEKCADALAVLAPRISQLFPVFKPLEGHPRFEAVQQRMLDHVNRERVEVGLEPLEKAYSL